MNLRAALIALAVLVALAMIGQSVVHADPLPCIPKDAALQRWEQRYGETPQALGRIITGPALVITANPDTGSWTEWVAPSPDVMCPVRAGDHWMVKNAVATSPSSFH